MTLKEIGCDEIGRRSQQLDGDDRQEERRHEEPSSQKERSDELGIL